MIDVQGEHSPSLLQTLAAIIWIWKDFGGVSNVDGAVGGNGGED